MRTFGRPGGVYLTVNLDLDREAYIVTNEDGHELFADGHELEAVRFCEDLIEVGP